MKDSVELGANDSQAEARRIAFDRGMAALRHALGEHLDTLLQRWTFEIVSGLTESGGEVDYANHRILLDAGKNSLSIGATEASLVGDGVLEPGDWTSVLPDIQAEPWSLLTYNMVHEVGHLLNVPLDPEAAPTKYSRNKPDEVTPEVFVRYAFGVGLSPEVSQAIELSINSEEGALWT